MTRLTQPKLNKTEDSNSRDSVVEESQLLNVNQKTKPVLKDYNTKSELTNYLFTILKFEIDGALLSLLLKSICGHGGGQSKK